MCSGRLGPRPRLQKARMYEVHPRFSTSFTRSENEQDTRRAFEKNVGTQGGSENVGTQGGSENYTRLLYWNKRNRRNHSRSFIGLGQVKEIFGNISNKLNDLRVQATKVENMSVRLY